jgi:hypothetical protein
VFYRGPFSATRQSIENSKGAQPYEWPENTAGEVPKHRACSKRAALDARRQTHCACRSSGTEGLMSRRKGAAIGVNERKADCCCRL